MIVSSCLYACWDSHPTDQDGSTCLHYASAIGLDKAVGIMLLVRPNCDIAARDSFGMTPLMLAASKDHAEVIDLLLKTRGVQGGEQDERGWTALHWAASCGSFNTICKFLDAKRNNLFSITTNRGETPLHLAAREGCMDIIAEVQRRLPRQTFATLLRAVTHDGRSTLEIARQAGFAGCLDDMLPSSSSSTGVLSDSAVDDVSPGKHAADSV